MSYLQQIAQSKHLPDPAAEYNGVIDANPTFGNTFAPGGVNMPASQIVLPPISPNNLAIDSVPPPSGSATGGPKVNESSGGNTTSGTIEGIADAAIRTFG